MCELVSAATMATVFGEGAAALTVLDAVMVAGTVMGAVGAVQSGQAQQKASEYNAQVAENDAIARQQAAAFEEERQRERARRQMGYMRASAAGSGTTMEGSPLDLMARSAEDAELDALAVRYQGQLGANAMRSQATADRMQGKMAAQQGWLSAGTTLLMGASKVGGKFFPGSPSAPSIGMVNTDIGYGPMRIAPRPSF